MYERGGGKTTKHGWVSETSSIGAESYLPRRFGVKSTGGATSRMQLPRFAHLHAAAFLHYIPAKCINVISNGAHVELASNSYNDVLAKLVRQKVLIVVAIKSSTARRKNSKDDEVELVHGFPQKRIENSIEYQFFFLRLFELGYKSTLIATPSMKGGLREKWG
jgi:hypothetical protein